MVSRVIKLGISQEKLAISQFDDCAFSVARVVVCRGTDHRRENYSRDLLFARITKSRSQKNGPHPSENTCQETPPILSHLFPQTPVNCNWVVWPVIPTILSKSSLNAAHRCLTTSLFSGTLEFLSGFPI